MNVPFKRVFFKLRTVSVVNFVPSLCSTELSLVAVSTVSLDVFA